MYGTSTIIYLHFRLTKNTDWLVVSTPLKNMLVSWDYDIPNWMEKSDSCSKPPNQQRFLGQSTTCISSQQVPCLFFKAIFVKDLLVFQMLSPRPTRWGPWCENRLNRAWPEGKHVCIYIYICYPPKDLPFQLFVDVKEVVFVGNLLQKQSRYTITFKKDEHILRSERHNISWRKQSVLNCSVPFHAWKKATSFINCNFPFQINYDFVQENSTTTKYRAFL